MHLTEGLEVLGHIRPQQFELKLAELDITTLINRYPLLRQIKYVSRLSGIFETRAS